MRKKMVKMKKRAAALVGERQQVEEALAISQANERRLEERVREERERAEKRYICNVVQLCSQFTQCHNCTALS